MKLKSKLSRIMLVFTIVIIVTLFLYVKYFISPSYEKNEAVITKSNYKKIESNLNFLFNGIEKSAIELGISDDTYNYINTLDNNFLINNLNEKVFKNLDVDFIYITDIKGNIIFAKECTSDGILKDLSHDIIKSYPSKGIIVDRGRTGLLVSKYVSKETVNVLKNGIIGTGIFLDDRRKDDVFKTIEGETKIEYYENNSILKKKYISKNKNKHIKIDTLLYNDIDNKYVIKFSLSYIRTVNILGMESINRFVIYILVTFLGLIGMMIYLLKKLFFDRIIILKESISDLEKNKGKLEVKLSGNDEITELRDTINTMLKKIDKITNELVQREEKYRVLYNESSALHLMVDEKYRIKDMNNAAVNMFGYDKEEILTESIQQVIHPEDYVVIKNFIDMAFLGMTKDSIEIRIINKYGDINYLLLFPTDLYLSEVNDEFSVLITGTDITELKRSQNKLQELATFDEMTGVLNRRAGLELLEKLIQIYKRNRENIVIAYIDVNDLKKVNDLNGHIFGDNLIKDAVEVLRRSIRESDSIVRLGGDEFLLIYPNLVGEQGINSAFNRINENIRFFNETSEKEYILSVSIGFASLEENMNIKINEFIENADRKMYQNKREHKEKKRKE